MNLNEFEDPVASVAITCEELKRRCQSSEPDLSAVAALADTIPNFDDEDAASASATMGADNAVSVLLSCLLSQFDVLRAHAERGDAAGVSNTGWLIKTAVSAIHTLAAPHARATA